jgi:transcriptional regulator with XRE-family HTH domain
MHTKSRDAKLRFAPGSSREPRRLDTLRAQMEDIERGDRIKELREARRLTQPAVVERMCAVGGPRRTADPFIGLRGYQRTKRAAVSPGAKRASSRKSSTRRRTTSSAAKANDAQPRAARAVDTDLAERLGTIEDRLDDLHAQRNGFMVLLEQQTTILARIEEATRTLDAAGEKWANRLSTTTRRIFEEAERDVQSREEARDRRATQRSPQG